MLHDSLDSHFRLSPYQKAALKKLGLTTVEDLLRHLPSRYGASGISKKISELMKGDDAVIYGVALGLKPVKAFRKKIPMAEGFIKDDTGKIKAVWFNQPYIAKMIPEGTPVRAEGKISERKGELYLSNPKIERAGEIPESTDSLFGPGQGENRLHPVYPESRGISSNWFYHAIQKALKLGALNEVEDVIPENILKKYNLPSAKTAFIWIHAPKNDSDALAARKRFAFEEVFLIQLQKQRQRSLYASQQAFKIDVQQNDIDRFISRFPFKPTAAQTRAIDAVLLDFKRGHPMARLLEGDVGSGKTFVAAATAYAAAVTRPEQKDFGNLQIAYMAPTEILARQQFESFIQFFAHTGMQIGLITGSGCLKFPSKVTPTEATDISRAQLLKWVANGEIPILVGTHALIQKNVRFKHLAYVIIDEQHRFGTLQRHALVSKETIKPHLLSMTATPIPRTLALTVYGDLDLTLLDELPPGRKTPETRIVSPDDRGAVYEKIRAELKAGRQAYIICPRIDEPDPSKELALLAKSVKEEAKRLKKSVFPEFEIDILHSKLKDSEKEGVMERFKEGEVKILVATSVVEVGVNVPNATIIVIEGAERFGLAQLHQLRGRVLRSSHQAYCFAFTDTKSGISTARLKALREAKNGFELAEFDLSLRGAGELYGRVQWGVSDVAMEALKNIKMVEAARSETVALISADPKLSGFPKLSEKLGEKKEIHFE